jgi:hypothetical protein
MFLHRAKRIILAMKAGPVEIREVFQVRKSPGETITAENKNPDA